MAFFIMWQALIHILIVLQIPQKASGQFTVHSPNNVVIQAVGEDAILPCYISAPSIPVSLTVQWMLIRALKRIEISSFNGRSEVERQGKSYKGRTAFFISQRWENGLTGTLLQAVGRVPM
nr:PREDICTED: butyrophilin subfamily 3 member A2-like [Haliaeetus albicilla]